MLSADLICSNVSLLLGSAPQVTTALLQTMAGHNVLGDGLTNEMLSSNNSVVISLNIFDCQQKKMQCGEPHSSYLAAMRPGRKHVVLSVSIVWSLCPYLFCCHRCVMNTLQAPLQQHGKSNPRLQKFLLRCSGYMCNRVHVLAQHDTLIS